MSEVSSDQAKTGVFAIDRRLLVDAARGHRLATFDSLQELADPLAVLVDV